MNGLICPSDPLLGVATKNGISDDDDDDDFKENIMANANMCNANGTENSELDIFGQNFTFSPPTIVSTLKYNGGQTIIELCVWLPSGVTGADVELSIAADNKHVDLNIPMDKYMGNGLVVHGDLAPSGPKVTRKEKLEHVRVDHWNTLIKENMTKSGQLPVFNASIELPDLVLRNTILRELVKQTPSGSRLLIIDLLVEEPKKPSASTNRETIVVIEEDVMDEKNEK